MKRERIEKIICIACYIILLLAAFFIIHLIQKAASKEKESQESVVKYITTDRKKMKKLVKNAAFVAMIMMMSLAFIQCKDAAITKFLEVSAEQQNKQCPLDMGNGMTLTKCSVSGSKTLKIEFSVSDNADRSLISESLKPTFVANLKRTAEFAKIKEFGIEYNYVFYDSNNQVLREIKITPDDYK